MLPFILALLLVLTSAFPYSLHLLRVFLRAINTYADTMNRKFLDNKNFEVQVRFLVSYSSLNCNAGQWVNKWSWVWLWASLSHCVCIGSSFCSYGTTTSIWLWPSLPRSPCSCSTSHPPRGTRSCQSECPFILSIYIPIKNMLEIYRQLPPVIRTGNFTPPQRQEFVCTFVISGISSCTNNAELSPL